MKILPKIEKRAGFLFFFCLLVLASFFVIKSYKNPGEAGFLSASASDKICSKDLFAESVKNISCESPQMALIQQNTVVGVCAPDLVAPKVLGSIISEEPEVKRSEIIEYTVGSDETLSSIAEKFNISQDTILWANDLPGKSAIKPGMELVILPVSGVLHIAKEGDTLAVIAGSYKVKEESIIAFNSLGSDASIYIGDALVVPNGKKAPKAAPKVDLIPIADAYFLVPAEGKISQGPHGVFARAIDIANSCGKPIVASAGGKVQRTGWDNTGGNIITILHPNGVVTYYGHLSLISVSAGQNVTAGQIIGYVGNTGYVRGITGCHLHFETRGTKNFMSRYGVGSSVSWK